VIHSGMCNHGVPFHYAENENELVQMGQDARTRFFVIFTGKPVYGAFPVRCSDIEPVVRYIENPHAHHSEMSFLQAGRSAGPLSNT
jgi:hypothetical protein